MSDSNSDPSTPKPRTIQAFDAALLSWMNDYSDVCNQKLAAMFDGDDLLRPKLRDLKEALPSLFDTLEPLARAHVRYKDIGDLVERIDLMLERMEVIAELLRPLRRIAVATRETIEAAI